MKTAILYAGIPLLCVWLAVQFGNSLLSSFLSVHVFQPATKNIERDFGE